MLIEKIYCFLPLNSFLTVRYKYIYASMQLTREIARVTEFWRGLIKHVKIRIYKMKGIATICRNNYGVVFIRRMARTNRPTMKEYASSLEKFGFGSLKTLRNIDSNDINNYLPEILPGRKKALLEETKKLITPVKVYNETDSLTVASAKCNKRQKQLDFGTSISTNGQNGNNSSENISVGRPLYYRPLT